MSELINSSTLLLKVNYFSFGINDYLSIHRDRPLEISDSCSSKIKVKRRTKFDLGDILLRKFADFSELLASVFSETPFQYFSCLSYCYAS